MPRHCHNAHDIEKGLFVATVDDLITPLPIIKLNLLKVGVFPGCEEDCHLCSSSLTHCPLLKIGIQRLIDNQEILFEKTPVLSTPVNDVSIITISANPSKVPKRPVRITSAPKAAPLNTTHAWLGDSLVMLGGMALMIC